MEKYHKFSTFFIKRNCAIFVPLYFQELYCGRVGFENSDFPNPTHILETPILCFLFYFGVSLLLFTSCFVEKKVKICFFSSLRNLSPPFKKKKKWKEKKEKTRKIFILKNSLTVSAPSPFC